jgi:serine/threonine protein kinase
MTTNARGKILMEYYILVKKIGSGAFGDVFVGIDDKNNNYAIKIEKSKEKSKLMREYKSYNDLYQKHMMAIPKIYNYIETMDYNMLVMELMGMSLEDAFVKHNKQFSISQVTNIAIQLIDVIAALHSRHYVHRDIKPNNFLIQYNRNDDENQTNVSCTTNINKIYIMDFGLTKKYIVNRQHIEKTKIKSLIGTPRYVSVNIHEHCEPSRRDDLISIGYMLIYFAKGVLPWQKVKYNSKSDLYTKIKECKKNTPLETLTCGLPIGFLEYMKYVTKLEFEETPNYNALKNMFFNVL